MRVALLERHADAGERAAGADGADEAVDLAVGLPPDLRAGASRNGRGGWRCCRTGWPRSRRSARSSRAARRGARRPSRSCWGRGRGRREPRSARRRRCRSVSFFSWLCVSGMTMTVRKPSASATSARPMPVLPAVPSTMTPPGCSAPRSIASRMMNSAARSLTDWPGFMNSALPRISQPVASDAAPEADQRRVADGVDDGWLDVHVPGFCVGRGKRRGGAEASDWAGRLQG